MPVNISPPPQMAVSTMNLAHFNKAGLKEKCKEYGLSQEGNDSEMIARLQAHLQQKSISKQPLCDPKPMAGISGQSTEASRLKQLEQICRESFLSRERCLQLFRRQIEIDNEFQLKKDDAITLRDAAHKRVEIRYQKDLADAEERRNRQLEDIQADLEKQKAWGPAFGELKKLRRKQGMAISPNDFDLARHPQHITPTPKLPHGSISAQTPVPPIIHGRGVAILTKAMDDAGSRATITSPLPTTNKRPTSVMDDNEEDFHRHAPKKPRVDVCAHSSDTTRTTSHNPYILVTSHSSKNRDRTVDRMKETMLKERIGIHHIDVDDRGIHWIFENSRRGQRDAVYCYWFFNRQNFEGHPLHLEMHF